MACFRRPQRRRALPRSTIPKWTYVTPKANPQDSPTGRPSAPKFRGGFDTIASMQAPGPQNPYEVYCYQCNVTAPAGTRRCLHCGGRLSGARDSRSTAFTDLLAEESSETNEGGEELAGSIGSAAPKVAMWILLVVGGFFYRLCN